MTSTNVRPQELVAIEVYHGSQAPPQFTAHQQLRLDRCVDGGQGAPDNNANNDGLERLTVARQGVKRACVFARTEMATECDVCQRRFDLVGGAAFAANAFFARSISTVPGFDD